MLEFRIEKVIDSSDLDALVVATYGKPFCFQQQDDCRDRGSYQFEVKSEPDLSDEFKGKTELDCGINGEDYGVDFQTWLNTKASDFYDGKPFYQDLWFERNFYPDMVYLLSDLCKRGLIEAGRYTIEVDW